MTQQTATIDSFLGPFLTGYRLGKSADTLRRIDYLERLLSACMEDAASNRVCDDCREMLALERIIDPVGAFPRVMEVECLADVLLAFVHRPWLRSDPVMQRAQWKLVEAAVDALLVLGLDWTPALQASLGSLVDHIDWELHRPAWRKRHRGR
jgi:hypothetical protein